VFERKGSPRDKRPPEAGVSREFCWACCPEGHSAFRGAKQSFLVFGLIAGISSQFFCVKKEQLC